MSSSKGLMLRHWGEVVLCAPYNLAREKKNPVAAQRYYLGQMCYNLQQWEKSEVGRFAKIKGWEIVHHIEI